MWYPSQRYTEHYQANLRPWHRHCKASDWSTLTMSDRDRRQLARDVTLGKEARRTPTETYAARVGTSGQAAKGMGTPSSSPGNPRCAGQHFCSKSAKSCSPPPASIGRPFSDVVLTAQRTPAGQKRQRSGSTNDDSKRFRRQENSNTEEGDDSLPPRPPSSSVPSPSSVRSLSSSPTQSSEATVIASTTNSQEDTGAGAAAERDVFVDLIGQQEEVGENLRTMRLWRVERLGEGVRRAVGWAQEEVERTREGEERALALDEQREWEQYLGHA